MATVASNVTLLVDDVIKGAEVVVEAVSVTFSMLSLTLCLLNGRTKEKHTDSINDMIKVQTDATRLFL